MAMTLKEYYKKKIFGTLGLVEIPSDPNNDANTFINDRGEIQRTKLREYNIWYCGDSDELLNFYTKENAIDYNYEPFFDRNKRSYFWSVASTEDDIKRTHSGQPRNIVDTLVNIVGLPKHKASSDNVNDVLNQILDDNSFDKMFMQRQLPLTLVEGWGCYKINWDKSLRDTPILLYYRADNVDFIYKCGQIVGIMFKDFYVDEKERKYLLIETRYIKNHRWKPKGQDARQDADGFVTSRSLFIEKELFEYNNDESLTPCPFKKLPQLKDVAPKLVIPDYSGFFAAPTMIFDDTQTEGYGRSIYTGKIDLFDDLDQCWSQDANSVRRSTVIEMMNTNYLERDNETGMPLMPNSFDRKYVMFNGGTNADGSTAGQDGIIVTQPQIAFAQFSGEAIQIMMQIINGIMSPATLGIDIAKKDNAEAQREKEKVTIFTRNTIIKETIKYLKNLFSELLCANELMNSGEITCKKYDITLKFDEFANEAFENKSRTILEAYNGGLMSPEMALQMLYGDTLSKSDYDRELQYIKDQSQQQALPPGMPGGMDPSAMGAFGDLGAASAYNVAQQLPENASDLDTGLKL